MTAPIAEFLRQFGRLLRSRALSPSSLALICPEKTSILMFRTSAPPKRWSGQAFYALHSASHASSFGTTAYQQIDLERIPYLEQSAGFSEPLFKECNSSQSYHLFGRMPLRESQAFPTVLEDIHDTHPNMITDPDFFTYLLKFLLVEGNSIYKLPGRVSQILRDTKTLHAQILKWGFYLAGNLGSSLVDLYTKFGNLHLAACTFKQLDVRDKPAWNSIISAYSKHGRSDELLTEFKLMWNSGFLPDHFSFSMALSACARSGNLKFGEELHCCVIKTGNEAASFCEGSLIALYAKCNCMVESRNVFDRITSPDVISWTSIVAGYVRVGLPDEGLKLFCRMEQLGIRPDPVMCVTAITAYVDLGKLNEARELFIHMQNPNVVAWNAMISGHVQNGYDAESVLIFQKMLREEIKPTRSTLGSVLCAVANLKALDQGQQFHSHAVKLGLDSNVYVGSSLINMYMKCSISHDATQLFEVQQEKNVVMWNAVLGGFSQNAFPNEAFRLFIKMKSLGVPPDDFTYAGALRASAVLGNLGMGKQLHSAILKSNSDASLVVGNALIDMYAKSEDLKAARELFECILNRDLITWNTIVVGYVHNEEEEDALFMFLRMRLEKIVPDEVSLVAILSACGGVENIKLGEQVHGISVKLCLDSSVYVGSSLIDMYAKSGDISLANNVFKQMNIKNIIMVNALMTGFIQNNLMDNALSLFRQIHTDGLEPSNFTFAIILLACGGPLGFSMGKQVHGFTVKSGFLEKDACLRVSLIGIYLQYLDEDGGKNLFCEMQYHTIISWTAIISGHAQNNFNSEALLVFQQMHLYGMLPDQSTTVSVLSACASLASLRSGKEVHSLVTKMGLNTDELTGSALIDMYAKCGEVQDSLKVFNNILGNKMDNILWNSLIIALAKNGFAEDSLGIFHEMQKKLVKPDEVTFLGALTGCSHAGLVSLGCGFFELMKRKYAILPMAAHYACIIDLLGRRGSLQEAENLIHRLQFESDPVIWASFLSACRIHGDHERGIQAAEKLILLEPLNPSPYVLLSNIHASSGNWDAVNTLRRTMNEIGVKKSPGFSWIVVDKRLNVFTASDKFHPMASNIYALLKLLKEVMKADGHTSELHLLVDDVD